MKFRIPYTVAPRVVVDCSNDPGCVKSEFKESCDVNYILMKYLKAGVQPHQAPPLECFGDYSSTQSYQDSQNLLIEVNEHFNTLPSAVRRRFANDPAAFLAFCEDSKNEKEMFSLGLIASLSSEEDANKSSSDDSSTTRLPVDKPAASDPPQGGSEGKK